MPRMRKSKTSVDALTLQLTAPPARYTDLDRARDFRRVLLGSDEGRRVLYHLLARCHVNDPSFLPGLDTHGAAFRDGERNVGLYVLHELTRDIDSPRPERAQSEREDA